MTKLKVPNDGLPHCPKCGQTKPHLQVYNIDTANMTATVKCDCGEESLAKWNEKKEWWVLVPMKKIISNIKKG